MLSGCSRRSHLIGDLRPVSRTRGFQSLSSSLQPALPLRGGRARGDKRGQASLEVIPGVSGRLASHLGGDVGAGVAAALRQERQQDGPEEPTSPCQEERACPEPQQSTCFVQCGQIMPDGPKWPFCPHPLCCSRRRSQPWGQRWQPGAFSPLFSSVFLRKASRAKNLIKSFSPHRSLAPKRNDR